MPEFAREYVGKVKLAYLDPPFNTQQAFEQYDDALEHSVWLTMMRDRLAPDPSAPAILRFFLCLTICEWSAEQWGADRYMSEERLVVAVEVVCLAEFCPCHALSS